ncbi:MAG: hypothetical protein J7J92_02850 [Candidatus Aenigmarchaeota archaeon]|nr:hypothetical protein [Candidatus Aenigmarchaeota archaeon]
MKGQTQIVTTMLLTMVTVAVVGTVYFYGLPLIEKNKDIATLQKTEDFIKLLDDKIKIVANGGSAELPFNIPGLFIFNNSNGTIEIKVKTRRTIYATGAEVPLVGDLEGGNVWGVNKQEIIYVKAEKVGNAFVNSYNLNYKQLVGNDCYKIVLESKTGSDIVTEEGHNIVISHVGIDSSEKCGGTKTLYKSIVQIAIV